MRKYNCSVEDACGRLSDGEFSERLSIYFPQEPTLHNKTVNVVWGKWKGMKIDTLKRKYYQQKSG